jgi:predicted kinase
MPYLILITGPMGSGKSTLAQNLCNNFAKIAYNLKMDDLKSYIVNYDINPQKSRELMNKIALTIAETNLSQGIDVVVEKCLNTEEVTLFCSLARRLEAPFINIVLDAPLNICIERIQQRRREHNLPTSPEYLDRITRSHQVARSIHGKIPSQYIFDIQDLNQTELTKKVLELLY